MTTPQSMLHDIHYKINELLKALNNGETDVFDSIEFIVNELGNIHSKISKLDNTMQLILELMNKDRNSKNV